MEVSEPNSDREASETSTRCRGLADLAPKALVTMAARTTITATPADRRLIMPTIPTESRGRTALRTFDI